MCYPESYKFKSQATKYCLEKSSPGVLVSSICCGNGCQEIKCPFDSREKFVFEMLDCCDSCLEGNVKNKIKLKATHMYYYQIQC